MWSQVRDEVNVGSYFPMLRSVNRNKRIKRINIFQLLNYPLKGLARITAHGVVLDAVSVLRSMGRQATDALDTDLSVPF